MTRLALLVFALLLLGAPAANAVALLLDGDGGDAWTFRKQIHGSVFDGSCDEIVLAAPAGAVVVTHEGPRFSATVPLQEGANELRALCRRNGVTRATSPPQRWIERLPDAPRAQARALIAAGGIVLDGASSEAAAGRPAPILRYEWRAGRDNPAPLFGAGSTSPLDVAAAGPLLTLQPPRRDGVYTVTLTVLDAYGRSDASTAAFRVTRGVPQPIDPARDHPGWIDDAVVYGAVPFFFGPRGLADITARLDAIAALGATVLWLSPITDGPDGDFGYAVTDHFRLRASLGSAADLRALVQAAHARKLRVILDVAANHLSDRHPYFLNAAQRGRASPYRDFFARDAAGKPTHYFDWVNLENLNYGNPEVRAYAIEAFARWVRDFDVDGFRVDASWGIKERAPDFWPRCRAELKRIKPDLLLLAEAPVHDPYYARNGFDAAYDWTDKLGEWAWRGAFDAADPAPRLRAALAASGDDDALVFRFLDNNDTGARFIARHGLGRTRVAAAMLLTLPGLPAIYMGDEVGADFLPYGARQALDWSDRFGLRDYYARLAALRHAEPALRSRAMTPVETSPAAGVLAYLRPGSSAAQSVLVVLNYNAEAAGVALARDETLADMLGDDGQLVDLVTEEAVAVDPARPAVSMPALSARVLRRAVAR